MQVEGTFDPEAAARAIGQGKPRVIDIFRRAWSQKLLRYESLLIQDDGTPLVMYFSPLTVADEEVAFKAEGDSTVSYTDRSLTLLVQKARDADGKPLFASTDIPYLKTEVHHQIIKHAIGFMYTVGRMSIAEAEEAIKKSPDSAS